MQGNRKRHLIPWSRMHLVLTVSHWSFWRWRFLSYPPSWKISKVIPLRKKDSGAELNRVRPISILPILSKVTEHLIKNQIVFYLQSSNLIYDCRCGFRNKRNTTSLLLGLTDSIRNNFDSNNLCVLLGLDLEKAFHRVAT